MEEVIENNEFDMINYNEEDHIIDNITKDIGNVIKTNLTSNYSSFLKSFSLIFFINISF